MILVWILLLITIFLFLALQHHASIVGWDILRNIMKEGQLKYAKQKLERYKNNPRRAAFWQKIIDEIESK